MCVEDAPILKCVIRLPTIPRGCLHSKDATMRAAAVFWSTVPPTISMPACIHHRQLLPNLLGDCTTKESTWLTFLGQSIQNLVKHTLVVLGATEQNLSAGKFLVQCIVPQCAVGRL